MNIVLPDSAGWSAAPLASDDWGRSGIVVKREYSIVGGVAVPAETPEGIVTSDTVTSSTDGDNIAVEGEMALFKSRTDWHFLGYGSGGNGLRDDLQDAEMRVNGTIRRSYLRNAVLPFVDPDNLFGHEPRNSRVGLDGDPDLSKLALKTAIDARVAQNEIDGIVMERPDVAASVLADEFGYTFVFDDQIPDVFWSSRRSDGYGAANSTLPVPASMTIEVEASDSADTFDLLTLSLDLPPLTVTAFVYEGGPDNAAFWCKRAPVTLVADTVTLDADTARVLWRASFDAASHPIPDMRQLNITEQTP